MKKMLLFKTAMAVLMGFAVFACKPVEPEGNGGNNPGENPGGNEPEVPVEVERSIKLYNADAEVTALEFTKEVTTYTLTVKANFQWDLDKDASTWPAWLVKLNQSVTGVLNETSELYEGEVTLTLDVANIASYYENKTGSLILTDANDLDYTFELPVTHTFEKPVEPESILSNVLGTNILTVTTDGKIKGTDSNTLEITITPGEGQTDFRGFALASVSYPPYDQASYEYLPAVLVSNMSTYAPGQWLTLSENDGKYILTVHQYPEAYEIPAGSGRLYKTAKALLFVFPSSVHGTFSGTGQNAGNDPSLPLWWNLNKAVFMDDSQYPIYTVREDYQKYVITLNVEQPAE